MTQFFPPLRTTLPLCAALLALLLQASPRSLPAQEPLSTSGELLDRIVALVDDGVVLKSELDRQLERVTAQLGERGTSLPPQPVLRQQVLETLIVQRIQLQRAERLGVQISDEQLNMALQQMATRNNIALSELPQALVAEGIDYAVFREEMRKEMILDSLRQRDVMARIAVSDREVERWLEQYETTRGSQMEYDIAQLLIALPQDPSPEQLQAAESRIQQLHARLLEGADFASLAVAESEGQRALEGGRLGWRRASALPDQFANVIRTLSPGEFSEPIRSSSGFHIFSVNAIRGGEDKVVELQSKSRHILLTPNEVHNDDMIRTRLELIRQRILDGTSFGDIAMLESEDQSSAARGGDLGWNPPGTFVPEFEGQLDRLSPGEISPPFRSPFGWHIVQLLEREERDTTEEVRRNRAMQAIRASKSEQEMELWLRRLRDEAWVEILGG